MLAGVPSTLHFAAVSGIRNRACGGVASLLYGGIQLGSLDSIWAGSIPGWASGPLFFGGGLGCRNNVTDRSRRLEGLISPSLEALGYDTIRVRLMAGHPLTLQILAEPSSGAAMTVTDCTEVSRHVSLLLDTADPFAGEYLLEVSSPGIDRPLVKPEDFERFCGHEVKIELERPMDGRRRLHGRIEGLEDGAVLVRLNGSEEGAICTLQVEEIASAKLTIPDDVLQKRRPEAAKG